MPDLLAGDVPGDEHWDGAFNVPPGVNGDVFSVVTLEDDVYVGGLFTKAGNIEAKGIARWDGKNWFPVGDGVKGVVYALAVREHELFVGGCFTTKGPVAATNLAKWNGSQWEALGAGIQPYPRTPFDLVPYVSSLAVHEGKLYAGGVFHEAGGIEAINVARWDGKRWSALGTGVGGQMDSMSYDFGRVHALVARGSELFAGGVFQRAGSVVCTNIARWDGKKWSALGGGLSGGQDSYRIENGSYSGDVMALAVHNHELYAGGDFTLPGRKQARDLARWDGSDWEEVGGGVKIKGSFYGAQVRSMVSDGEDLYVAGYFEAAGDTALKNIARWTGSKWRPIGRGVSGPVGSLSFLRKTLFAGGTFGLADGRQAGFVAQWHGANWSPLGRGTGNTVVGQVATIAANGEGVFVGGSLLTAGNIEGNSLMELNGTTWSQVGRDVLGGSIRSVAVAGSNLYVAGSFVLTEVGATNLACWNGFKWSSLGSGLFYETPFYSGSGFAQILAAGGGKLYVAGAFNSAGGVPAPNLAVWDGTNWSSLGEGLSSVLDSGFHQTFPAYVHTLAVDGDKLFVGGQFNRAGSSPAENLAQWDGTAWTGINGGPFGGRLFNSSILNLAIQSNRLFVSGAVVAPSGSLTLIPIVSVWDGSTWSELISTNAFITSMAVNGPNLYVGGFFTNIGGISANHIARWDGANWFPLGSGLDGEVDSLATEGTSVYAGGTFTTAGGKSSYHFAVWHGP